MGITLYPEVNGLLDELFSRIQGVMGDKLVGLYLGGSLVWGDFDERVSDIDLVAALSSFVTDHEFEKLKKMHTDFVKVHEEWNDRIEVCYVSVGALRTVKSKVSPMVNISPGEPIHRIESKMEWLMNWYLVREKSTTLFGSDPKSIIEPISKDDFLQSIKDHIKSWGEWVKDMRERNAQAAYVILTMCRALYVYKHGDQVSKKQAAIWAEKEFPQWGELIRQAIVWRKVQSEEKVDDETYIMMVKLVSFVSVEILQK